MEVYWLRGNHDYIVPSGPWRPGVFYTNRILKTLAEHGDFWDKGNWPPGPTNKGSRLVIEPGAAFEVHPEVLDDGTITYLMSGVDNLRPWSDDAVEDFLDRRSKYSDVAALAALISRLKFVGAADDSAAYQGALERRRQGPYQDWLMVQGHTHMPAAVPGVYYNLGTWITTLVAPEGQGSPGGGISLSARVRRPGWQARRGILRGPPRNRWRRATAPCCSPRRRSMSCARSSATSRCPDCKISGREPTGVSRCHPAWETARFCYLEIPATDVPRSVAFYQAVFGWSIRERGDGSIAFDDGVGQVSGTWVAGRPPSTEPGLLVYIMVDSLDATSAAVQAQGGEMVQPVGQAVTRALRGSATLRATSSVSTRTRSPRHRPSEK